jgi:hypothetical protein
MCLVLDAIDDGSSRQPHRSAIDPIMRDGVMTANTSWNLHQQTHMVH